MKTLTVLNTLHPYSPSEINSLFKNFGIELPIVLTNFLSTYGGADVYEYRYIIKDKVYVINDFLPVKSSRHVSIESMIPVIQDKDEGIGRNDLIPFATDPGGNPYYVSIGQEDYYSVYIDTISSRGFEEPIVKIADSFEEFIDALQPESEDM